MKSYLFGILLICFLLSTTAFAVSDGSIIEDVQLVSQNEDNVIVDKQVMVVADLSNGQDRSQNFVRSQRIFPQMIDLRYLKLLKPQCKQNLFVRIQMNLQI